MYGNQLQSLIDSVRVNLILYLFNEDCQQPMSTIGFPQNTYLNT